MKMIKTLAMVSMVGFATFGTTASAGVVEDATDIRDSLITLKRAADKLAVAYKAKAKVEDDVAAVFGDDVQSKLKMRTYLTNLQDYTGVTVYDTSTHKVAPPTYASSGDGDDTEAPADLTDATVFPTTWYAGNLVPGTIVVPVDGS